MFKRFTQDICMSDYNIEREFRNQIGLAGTDNSLGVSLLLDKSAIKITPRNRTSESFIIVYLIAITLLPIFTVIFSIATMFTKSAIAAVSVILTAPFISAIIAYPLIVLLTNIYNKTVHKNNPEEYSKENIEKNQRLYSDISKLPEVELDIKIAKNPEEILRQYEAIVNQNIKDGSKEISKNESIPDLFDGTFKS